MAELQCPERTLKELKNGLCVFKSPTNIGVAAQKTAAAKTQIYFIDAGESPDDAKKALEECGRLFGEFQLKAVICTHAHADHIGGAAWLKQKTSCEVWATQAEKSVAETPQIQAQSFYGAHPLPEIDIPYFHSARVDVDRVIEAGQKIACGGLEFEFVSLPGHSFDMVGVLAKSADATVFYAGDGIFSRSMLSRFWTPFIVDVRAFKESIGRAAGIQADYYVPSHGLPCDEASGICELNLISTISNEKLIEDILAEPKTHEELLKAFCDKSGIQMRLSQYMLIGSTLRSYLTYLYKEGRVKWFFEGNKMYWQAL